MLEELGAIVIHADTVGHEVYLPHTEGWRQVTAAFGTELLQPDQTIDRKKLGTIVFSDPQALKRLNAIVHPLIAVEIQGRIEHHRAGGTTRPIVVEAALLIEANWLPLVDEVWLVMAAKEAVVERVAAQRGLSPQEIGARVETQLNDRQRRKYAQVVIENDGTLAQLRERVGAAWARVRSDPP